MLPSLVDLALTNSAAFESVISSDFAGGATPSWFSALPTDVQDFIAPTNVADSDGISTTSSTAYDDRPSTTGASGAAAVSTSSDSAAAATVIGLLGLSVVGAVGVMGIFIM